MKTVRFNITNARFASSEHQFRLIGTPFRNNGTWSGSVHKAYAEKILVSEHPSCILITKEPERLIYKAFRYIYREYEGWTLTDKKELE